MLISRHVTHPSARVIGSQLRPLRSHLILSIISLGEKQQSVSIHKHVGKLERTQGSFIICPFAP